MAPAYRTLEKEMRNERGPEKLLYEGLSKQKLKYTSTDRL